jgi:hypothetical protein
MAIVEYRAIVKVDFLSAPQPSRKTEFFNTIGQKQTDKNAGSKRSFVLKKVVSRRPYYRSGYAELFKPVSLSSKRFRLHNASIDVN